MIFPFLHKAVKKRTSIRAKSMTLSTGSPLYSLWKLTGPTKSSRFKVAITRRPIDKALPHPHDATAGCALLGNAQRPLAGQILKREQTQVRAHDVEGHSNRLAAQRQVPGVGEDAHVLRVAVLDDIHGRAGIVAHQTRPNDCGWRF